MQLGLILLLGGLLRCVLLASLLVAARCVVAKTDILASRRIIFFCLLKGFLNSLDGCGATRFLNLARNFRAFRGDFLSKRRTIKLEKTFDFFLGVVFVVNDDKLFGYLIDVKFFS